MENASKALLIAAGVLLSIMVVSLLVYTAKSFGKIARAEQEAKLIQDKETFNAEYEAYEKNLMYGTDVLSCLNKAQSNNQKYVNNRYFGRDNLGSETRMEYLIDVEVKLHTDIEEEVLVYKLNSSGKKVLVTSDTSAALNVYLFKETTGTYNQNIYFELPDVVWYYFEDGVVKKGSNQSYQETLWKNDASNWTVKKAVENKVIRTNLEAGTYHLFDDGETDIAAGNIGILSALLSTATLTEQTIINEGYGNQTDIGETSTDWYCVTWRTAAYDFKTKKFKCNGIEYNEETGYVSKIKFEEVTSY